MGKQRRTQGLEHGQGKPETFTPPVPTGDLLTGTIKRLVTERGFGFVRTVGGLEYFFHRSGVVDGAYNSLSEGAAVTFLAGEQGPKGLRAEQVQLIG